MPLTDPAIWTERLRQTLQCYDEVLLRQVSDRLLRPRSQWPVAELIDRCVSAMDNPAGLDRRLKDLEPAGRQLLALVGHSRQPRWPLGNLIELMMALGHSDGLVPVLALLEAGLLYPELAAIGKTRLKKFEQWLSPGQPSFLRVFAHPAVTSRALGTDLGLPECPGATVIEGAKSHRAPVHEADGLEWPLRLAVLWQQVAAAPLRRTQQRDFFKRDLDRLRGDPLLSTAPAESLGELPDAGLFTVALAMVEGVLEDHDGELHAGSLPAAWAEGVAATVASLWAGLPLLEAWDAARGWQPGESLGNPYASANLLALLLLENLPKGSWAQPEAVAQWIVEHHPYWRKPESAERGARSAGKDAAALRAPRSALCTFLLGLAFPLRLLQATKDAQGNALIRLSPLGRWVLGLGEMPSVTPGFPQTLLVQPNLEVLVYRQGLTPDLIARLGRFAAWKGLGAACTLQLQPETVYRALESGETFETILQALERHGMKSTPVPVIESLRTWANKRERLSVYPSAALFEFAGPDELNEALARGLPAVRLTDRLAVVPNEDSIDYRHFRLTSTRDYALPPEKCVDIEPDGVTLSVDLTRSDLLLESELERFAEMLPQLGLNGRRLYRLTPATLEIGRRNGLTLPVLEAWFQQRSRQPLSPAARLLLTAPDTPPLQMQKQWVLHVAGPEIADGLQQWPASRGLIQGRLGPTALAVAEEHIPALQQCLCDLALTVRLEEKSPAAD